MNPGIVTLHQSKKATTEQEVVTGMPFEHIEDALCQSGVCGLEQVVAKKAENQTAFGVDFQASEGIVQRIKVTRPVFVTELFLELESVLI